MEAGPSPAAHLEALRSDIRDEIKRRIEQRDKFSIQVTLGLAAIFAFAASEKGDWRVLLAAPMLSVYYTYLILYSYRVHRVLATYLRDQVEPALARTHGLPVDVEWETYYARHAVPGIRRPFFVGALWITTLAALAALFKAASVADPGWMPTVAAASVIYLAALGWITYSFRGEGTKPSTPVRPQDGQSTG